MLRAVRRCIGSSFAVMTMTGAWEPAATVPGVSRERRWPSVLGPILIGVAGAAIALFAFGRTTVDAGPFQVQLEAGFGPSVTDISLPPLGRLRADTHGAPLHLQASLSEVDVEDLRDGLRRGLDSVAAEVERLENG